jgi:hypothetical protein
MPEIAFSRYANIGLSPPAPAAAKPRILVVISNPADIETKFGLPAINRTLMLTRLKTMLDQLAAQAEEGFDAGNFQID